MNKLSNYIRGIPTRMRFVLLLAVDTVVKLTCPRTSGKDVLVTRLDAIGDFIVWLDAARAISARYRREGRRVILAGNAAWADWAREMDVFDQVLPIDMREYQSSPRYRYRIGRAVQQLACEIAIQPIFSRNWLFADSVVRVSGARERIGNAGDTSNTRPWQIAIANRWFTKILAVEPGEKTELERNAEFVRNLGERDFRMALPEILVDLEFDSEFAAAVAGEPYYVLFPGASWKGREWPVEKFAEIANKIYTATGWRCVICGGPTDSETATALSEGLSLPLVNWVGRTSLSQLASILAGAKLLVTNETSATHMAAATRTPTVCILGGGHYGRFMPYPSILAPEFPLPKSAVKKMPCFGCNWNCIYKVEAGTAVPCIRDVETDQVWSCIQTLLDRRTEEARNQATCTTLSGHRAIQLSTT